jgi:hypothetical protein
MIRRRVPGDGGLTGLEIVILAVVIITGLALLLTYLDISGSTDLSRAFPGGLLAESMYMTGDTIHPVGKVFGYPMVSGNVKNLSIITVREDPGELGVARVVVSLFMGDTGAIDMSRMSVGWDRAGSFELIQRTTSPMLVCPNWTISGKYNLLPGRTADADDWLEPNEQFELTLCASDGVLPYRTLSFTLKPDGAAMPLSITRPVPSAIQPVMNLG